MAYSLRLIEDRLAAGAAAPAPRVPRVLYARTGALLDGLGAEVGPVGPSNAFTSATSGTAPTR